MQIKNIKEDEDGYIAECVLYNKESKQVESSFFIDKDKANEIIDLMKGFIKSIDMMNEAQNNVKPILCEVAVFSNSERYFRLWLEENRKENERYHLINREEHLYGREFHRIEKLANWSKIPHVDDLLQYCLLRLRSSTQE